MGQLYDGDRLKAKLRAKKLSVDEITSRAGIGKSTYHRMTQSRLLNMTKSVQRVLDACEISEEEIVPIAGFRTIDSAEFLKFFVETISVLRIDIDTLVDDVITENEKKRKQPGMPRVISNTLLELGSQLHRIVLDRGNYAAREWSETINDFWNRCQAHRVLLSYVSHSYEFVPPEDDSELFAIGTRTYREPVIRVMGQLFLSSTSQRSNIAPSGQLCTPDEWRDILFRGKFQTYVPLDPDRNSPHVEWDKGNLFPGS